MTVSAQLRAIADRLARGEGETSDIIVALHNVARELEQRPVFSGLYTIALRKDARTWRYVVKNPVGGKISGAESDVPQRIALMSALDIVPPGARYLVIVDGEPELEQIKSDSVR